MKQKKDLSPKDIAQLVKWSEVKRALDYHYPNYKNNYKKLFERIQNTKKIKIEEGLKIEIYGGLDIESEWYDSDYGLKFMEDLKSGEESLYYGVHLIDKNNKSWSTSFQAWNSMINTSISHDTLKHYMFSEILAHFMHDLTFFGDEKRMKKIAKNVFDSARKIEKQKKNEKR